MALFTKDLFWLSLKEAVADTDLEPLKAAEEYGLPTTPIIVRAIGAVRKDPEANKFPAVWEIAWDSVPRELKL